MSERCGHFPATMKDRKLREISRVLVNWEKLFALLTKNKRQLCLFSTLILFLFYFEQQYFQTTL